MPKNSSQRLAGGGEPRVKVALAIVAMAVVVGLVIAGAGALERLMRQPSERGDASARDNYYKTEEIEYKGATYRRKHDLTTILLMGIDRYTTSESPITNRNGGQADFLRLLVIDNEKETIHQIAIDRDTMTPITILGVLGNRAGMRTERISLSHGFGDGKEQSCELTVDAVTNLLYGTSIDFYVAMEMDGIAALNDWLGGVTVTLEDDFTTVDSAMQEGATITLAGEQAEIYVRERRSAGIGTNEARMVRQQQFINQAEHLLKQRLNESDDAAEVFYNSLKSFLTTNMSKGRVINEIYLAKAYELGGVLEPVGVHEVDEQGFMQFLVDEESLQSIIVSTCYTKL